MPIKGILKPQGLIFFILLSQIESKTMLRAEERKSPREIERERGVDLLKERNKKKPTSSSHFSKPKPKVT